MIILSSKYLCNVSFGMAILPSAYFDQSDSFGYQQTVPTSTQEIDPITRIYKKMEIDSIHRSRIDDSMFCRENYEKEQEVLKIQKRYFAKDYPDICNTELLLAKMAFENQDFTNCIQYCEDIKEYIELFEIPASTEFLANLYSLSGTAYQILREFSLSNNEFDHIIQLSIDNYTNVACWLDMASNYLQEGNNKQAEVIVDNINSLLDDNLYSQFKQRIDLLKLSVYRFNGDYYKCFAESSKLVDEFYKLNDINLYENTNLGSCILFENYLWSALELGNVDKIHTYVDILIKMIDFLREKDPTGYSEIANLSNTFLMQIYIQEKNKYSSLYEWRANIDFEKLISSQKNIINNLSLILGNNNLKTLEAKVMLSIIYYHAGLDTEFLKIGNDLLDTLIELNLEYPMLFQNFLINFFNVTTMEDTEEDKNELLKMSDLVYSSIKNSGYNYRNCELYEQLFYNYRDLGLWDKAREIVQDGFNAFKDLLSKNILEIEDIVILNTLWNEKTMSMLYGSNCEALWSDPECSGILYDKILYYKGMKLMLFSSLNDRDKKDQYLNLSWIDIQSKLIKHEGAVEIVGIKTWDKQDSIYMNQYYAFCLTESSNAPEIFHLCNENDINRYKECYYNSNEFTRIVVGKLLDWCNKNKIQTLYYSPMGEYCNISFDALLLDKSLYLTDILKLVRLSSTRELCIKTDEQVRGLLAFGDINYNKVHGLHKTNIKRVPDIDRKLGSFTSTFRKRVARKFSDSAFPYLYGTKVELDSICSIFHCHNINYKEFRDSLASEHNFRILSPLFENIIHIATHGFYIEEDNNVEMSNNLLDWFSKSNSTFIEDKSLFNSGLVLAGVNKSLSNINPYDDGILTAFEISELDLNKINMVILSACETALGNISGDQIFGLQRGFKRAGVQSLLMSLWEVDDEATQILMTEFYKNYLCGMSKQKSLNEAQKAVRETPGFEDPEYWAAFILLDALN